jgi:hypothetical protein
VKMAQESSFGKAVPVGKTGSFTKACLNQRAALEWFLTFKAMTTCPCAFRVLLSSFRGRTWEVERVSTGRCMQTVSLRACAVKTTLSTSKGTAKRTEVTYTSGFFTTNGIRSGRSTVHLTPHQVQSSL